MNVNVEVEAVCGTCGKTFWRPNDGSPQFPRQRCPECKTTKTAGESASSLVKLAAAMPTTPSLFEDIHQLLRASAVPIEAHERTFAEWLCDVDVEAEQMEKKRKAGDRAAQLLKQRLELIRQFQEIAKTTHEAEEVQIERRRKRLEAYRDTLKLEEEITEQLALQAERVKTKQLEEASRQRLLLQEMEPPALPPPPEDPGQKTINEVRSNARTRAAAKQFLISDCLDQVWLIYRSEMEEDEKAFRIRAVMDAFRQDPEVLPPKVRRLIERVDSPEWAA